MPHGGRHCHPNLTQPGEQLAVPPRFSKCGKGGNSCCDQLQIQLLQTLDREGEVHLLHFPENSQIRNIEDAATDFFQHFLGQGTAYRGQIQPGCPWRLQRAGTDFSHAAGCSLEQEYRRFGCGLFQPTLEFLDEGRSGEGIKGKWRTLWWLVVLEGLLHARQQFLQRNRFLKKVEGTKARRFDRRIDRSVTRHHDDRHVQVTGSMPLLEQGNAIHIRHPDIEQDEIRPQFIPDATCRPGMFGQTNVVTLVDQNFREQFTNTDFVVNDQNYCHSWLPLL